MPKPEIISQSPFIVIWRMSKGEEVPRHSHDESDEHVIVVVSGAVELFGSDWSMSYVAGESETFTPSNDRGFTHGIRAMTDNTVVVNVNKRIA